MISYNFTLTGKKRNTFISAPVLRSSLKLPIGMEMHL